MPIRQSVNPSTFTTTLEVVVGIGIGRWTGRPLARHAVTPFGPPREVFVPAPLAAERLPALADRMPSTQDAQTCLAHPIHSIPGGLSQLGRSYGLRTTNYQYEILPTTSDQP